MIGSDLRGYVDLEKVLIVLICNNIFNVRKMKWSNLELYEFKVVFLILNYLLCLI